MQQPVYDQPQKQPQQPPQLPSQLPLLLPLQIRLQKQLQLLLHLNRMPRLQLLPLPKKQIHPRKQPSLLQLLLQKKTV